MKQKNNQVKPTNVQFMNFNKFGVGTKNEKNHDKKTTFLKLKTTNSICFFTLMVREVVWPDIFSTVNSSLGVIIDADKLLKQP